MDVGEGPGRTLFQFVRYWARRWPRTDDVDRGNGRDVLVTEAVLARRAGTGATVNDVADELGIDQSGASRLVAQAVLRGYLCKAASPEDARRRVLLITDKGVELLTAAHDWQESVFAELTADWSEEEVRSFHRSMARLMARCHGK
ncbi:MarR family winged helix-turn-helix transcriptional regulator [Qaidamihabitans albus]|uniref:MarR family winged helix-turn-helix transcriptional regulator n=1 Tax=Qaidamihabitans albus TaxID=2795733 RepID=UPI0018F2304C|nr:MarR family winged helix-turn-helix transcriptional regulator [Qaidamihabitans albus]